MGVLGVRLIMGVLGVRLVMGVLGQAGHGRVRSNRNPKVD